MNFSAAEKQESGFSLVELIVSVSILSIVLLPVVAINLNGVRQVGNTWGLAQVKVFRSKLIQVIQSNDGWRRSMTQPQNAAMNCLRRPNSTCPNVGYNPATNPLLAVYNAAGLDDETYYDAGGPTAGAIYDATAPGNGITANGRKCTGFSATTSTPHCPFRFNLRWYALSNTPSPMVAVYGTLEVSPNTQNIVNPENYSIVSLIRSAQ